MRWVFSPLVALLLAGPAPAQCLIGCDAESSGPPAEEALGEILGKPLPKAVGVAHLLDGGFQDRFIQARIEVEGDEALYDLLAAMGLPRAGLRPRQGEPFGPGSGPAWWNPESRTGLRVGEGTLPGFDYVLLGTAPDMEKDGSWSTIYIWAFQT